MMPDKMGIIGNTQGVSANSKPKPKKPMTINQSFPPLSSVVAWSSEVLICSGDVAGTAVFGVPKTSEIVLWMGE